LNLLIIAFIFIYLHKKKRIYFTQRSIKKSIELWLSKILLREDESAEYVQVPLKFEKHFRNKTKREFTVRQLIDIKKNLSGKIIENIINVYEYLGFKRGSLIKFKSKVWHTKVKGIHELYMMDQSNMLPLIYKYTNSDNEYVRMEAQAAVIHFSGFEGLRFLDMVSHPISEWEQLKLLEQLKLIEYGEMKNISKWLRSQNWTVVLFALKLVDVCQEFHLHDEVAECLKHESEKVRAQALTTLARIANENTALILVEQYYKETFANKQKILQSLALIGSDDNKDFLLAELQSESDSTKLAAAKVIAKCCSNGLALLKEKAKEQPQPYSEIYFHLKNELQQ
jgi:hypothetical protein